MENFSRFTDYVRAGQAHGD